jgi:hypothetical protein
MPPHPHSTRRRIPSPARRGQATVEIALVMLAVLLCLAGLLVVHRIVDARLQVETLARETARVMGEAGSYDEALAAGEARFRAVAAGLTLDPARLTVRPEAEPAFGRDGLVGATVTYRVPLGGLPSFGLGEPTVSADARQPVQRFGSRPPAP